MIRLFRRKMFSVGKYFRRNHFREKKKIPKNIFRLLARTKNERPRSMPDDFQQPWQMFGDLRRNSKSENGLHF
jgi:hypothetical protein